MSKARREIHPSFFVMLIFMKIIRSEPWKFNLTIPRQISTSSKHKISINRNGHPDADWMHHFFKTLLLPS
jgi:hypothetical protein